MADRVRFRIVALHLCVLALCGVRAGLAAVQNDRKPRWPFLSFRMYSNHETASIRNGVPVLIATGRDGRPCRVPTGPFGSRWRHQFTFYVNHLRVEDALATAQRLCRTELGDPDVCTQQEYHLILLRRREVGAGPAVATGYRISRDNIFTDYVGKVVEDMGAVVPRDFCGDRAGI